MPTEYAGVLAIPLIIGLVEAAKRMGLDAVWATPLAVGLGLAVSVGYVAAQQLPGSETWLDAVLWGLALGLSASGLYSGTREAVRGQVSRRIETD
ncbi:MAG TPA: hypothetical protein VF960_01565 [Chloroflexota bacterium]